MFESVIIPVLIATAAAAALHQAVFGRSRRQAAPGGSGSSVRRWCPVERLVHWITTLGFLAAALTGLGGVLRQEGLSGWWLWWHMVSGPVFAVGLTVTAVLWAERSRFAQQDVAWIRRLGGFLGHSGTLPAGRFDAGQKLFFWLSTSLGFASLASIMATMIPLLGQGGQAALIAIHRWSGLGLAALVILHAYATVLAKPGTWRSIFTGRVDVAWAMKYHPLWWKELSRKGDKHDEEN